MSKTLINFILITSGCIVLYFMAQYMISHKVIPSINSFTATTTLGITEGTSSTAQVTGTTTSVFDLPTTTLFSETSSVKVYIANNDQSREQGLSDIKELPTGNGALFIFDSPGKYGFWMKDMNFPIDMIWIDENKMIAGVTKNVLPSSYPFIFMPPRPILYVLEMNVGSVEKFGLKTGTSVRFSLP